MAQSHRVRSLAILFLKLGILGFGGPQAHIALQHEEAVVRRGWLSEEAFTEGLALCEMLPGPASTQMGIYLGYLRAGHWGAIVSGVCFIAPAYLIVLLLSWGYFRFQGLPQVHALFLGVSPVVTAIVIAFCWTLGQKVLKDWKRRILTIVVLLTTAFTSVSVLLQFLVCGLLGCLWFRSPPSPPNQASGNQSALDQSTLDQSASPRQSGQSEELGEFGEFGKTGGPFRRLPLPLHRNPTKPLMGKTIGRTIGKTMPAWFWSASFLPFGGMAFVTPLSDFWGFDRLREFALPLMLFFLKVGSFIFGGGLVIIPLLEFEVVERFQWLTHTEFIHGVAIGQLSPGPVVLTAAFVGYKVAGVAGSLIATIAIFLPSFLFILLATPLLLRIRQNPWIKAFLQGVTPATLGAITAASLPIAQASLMQSEGAETLIAFGILSGSLIALIHFKTPTWQLVSIGAIVGLSLGHFY